MNKTIFIIEDDEALAAALSDKLESLGYRLIRAEDGDQAVETVQSKKPDLVLLDLVLPGKSGFEILEDLKIKKGLSVPVIVLTNLSQPEDQKRGLDLGAVDYILKSNTSLSDVGAKVAAALKAKNA